MDAPGLRREILGLAAATRELHPKDVATRPELPTTPAERRRKSGRVAGKVGSSYAHNSGGSLLAGGSLLVPNLPKRSYMYIHKSRLPLRELPSRRHLARGRPLWRRGASSRSSRRRSPTWSPVFMAGPAMSSEVTPSEQRLRASGLPSLRAHPPLQDGPAVLLKVPWTHRDRVIARMCGRHHACPLFEETCQKNDVAVMLFKAVDVDRLVDDILLDHPLCAALARAPFVASRQTESIGVLAEAFKEVCACAHSKGDTVMLSAPETVRRSLLEAVLETPWEECLVTGVASRTYHIASAVRCAAFFYHTKAAPTRPSASQPRGSATSMTSLPNPHPWPLYPRGHWHASDTGDAGDGNGGEEGHVCRASYKLSEVFVEDESFGAALTAATAKAVCIDIGASPGGWTDLLSRYCRVIAIDPGSLHPTIAARERVHHLAMLLADDEASTAAAEAGQDSITRLRAAMAPATQAALVCCDANIPPMEAARLVRTLARQALLSIGCKLVLTLKSPRKVRASTANERRAELANEALGSLGGGFKQLQLRHGFANTQHEYTLTATYAGESSVACDSGGGHQYTQQVGCDESPTNGIDPGTRKCDDEGAAGDDSVSGTKSGVLASLEHALQAIDASATFVVREGAGRHCTNASCLCNQVVLFRDHQYHLGHVALPETVPAAREAAVLAERVRVRIEASSCLCCKQARATAKRQAAVAHRVCQSCQQTGHLPRHCPKRRCHYCGSQGHSQRECRFGLGARREDQFLRCSPQCFVRRFVVPLHRAHVDFDATNLRGGRVDLACRLLTAALIASQRLRHNTQLWLPFLGDSERPQTLCVSGGAVRSLHPCEDDTAARLRHAFDSLSTGPAPEAATTSAGGLATDNARLAPSTERDLRGFRVLPADFQVALTEALMDARCGGTAAPLLLLLEGAPPLSNVLADYRASAGVLTDLVIVLGDDRGLTEEEIAMVHDVGTRAGGGGPVICASIGSCSLLASQCIVLVHHYLDAIHNCPSRLWESPTPESRHAARQIGRRVSSLRRAGK